MKEILKPMFALLIITLAFAALLGAADFATRDLIAENDAANKKLAMKDVLPSAADFADEVIVSGEGNIRVKAYSAGVNGGDTIGYVFTAQTKGYGGIYDVIVGVDADGRVTGVKLGANSETPGLGKNAENAKFSGQFNGKQGQLIVTKTKAVAENEIEAIAAATITSKAVTNAVNAAAEYFDTNLKGGKK